MTKPKGLLPKWGLHPRTPEHEYRYWAAANYSAIKEFQNTPLHVYQYLTDPPPATPAMELGNALHTAILEPDRFSKRYVRGAAGNLTRKGPREENNQIKADNPSKQLIRDADWPKIVSMRDAVWRHPRAREVLSGDGLNECAYLWADPATGLACKAKVDRIGMSREGWPCVVDYKTFGERGGKLTTHAIESVIYDRLYHIQAAHYLNGLNAIQPFQRRYILMMQEKAAPFAVRMVEIDFAAMELGKRQVARWLKQLKRCQDTGRWPGWSEDFDPMGVPEYAYSQEPEDDDE
jgi:hypothetical protein